MNQRQVEQKIINAADFLRHRVVKIRESAVVSSKYAGWGRRAAAVMVDIGLYTMVAFIGFVLLVVPLVGGEDPQSAIKRLGVLILVLTTMLLPLLMLSPWLLARNGDRNGQTWGKRLLGIRVVRDDEQPWTFGRALLRQAAKLALPQVGYAVLVVIGMGLSQLLTGQTNGLPTQVASVVGLLGVVIFYLWPLRERERRGIHDKLLHSHVERVPHI